MEDRWHNCVVCESEYKVINSISDNDPEFCPFCGSQIDPEFDSQEDEEDEEDDNDESAW